MPTELGRVSGRHLRDHVVQSPYFENAASSPQKSDLPPVVQPEGAELALELRASGPKSVLIPLPLSHTGQNMKPAAARGPLH